ncbi:MAG: hypothetical protein PGN33_14225 [Methylobacterium radiotolerans]
MISNYENALKAETKRVVRCFQHYGSEVRANHQASHRLGHRQRESVGEFFYVHPDLPGRAFSKRKFAAAAALQAQEAM